MDPRPLIPRPPTTSTGSTSAVDSNNKAPLKESVLMFFAAAGCTICYTSVLSNLVYYSLTMGVESYLFLNLTIYGPMLPITIAQTIWDGNFDREVGSLGAYSFRGLLGFSVSCICILLMPFANQLIPLLIVSLFLGLASATLHGMLKQMASFIYPGCFRLAAAATAGMQASAAPVLFVSFATGFGRGSSSDGIRIFYFSIAGLLLFCWGCFRILISNSTGVSRGMQRQDSMLLMDDEDIIEPIISEREVCLESENNPPILHQARSQHGELPTWELWKKTQPACFIIMITVASSMSVACWLNRVKSQNPENEAFAQVLFYTRLLGDLVGRPATLHRTPTSISNLVFPACFRLSFVPVFFLYTTTNIIPKWDIAAIVGIFMFALTSGYLATLVYQLAPSLLNDRERERNLTRQTGLINVCFSVSILLGFGLTFAIGSIIE
jgi:hypothetical protein